MKKKILIVGLGNLGAHVLDLLARRESQHEIVVAGRNETYLNHRKNLSLFCAAQQGLFPRISSCVIDLNNIDQTAQTIAEVKPDIIFNTATLQSWRIITQLPKEIFSELDKAEFGPWLPMHLVPVHKLMQAVKASGISPIVVNAAFPDAVNSILSKVGLAPTVGIGNVANILPAFRYAIACERQVSPSDVALRFVGQHYLTHRIPRTGDTGGAAYHLNISIKGQDVTNEINMEQIFPLLTTQFKRIGGVDGQALTAASALSVLSCLLNETDDIIHAPGPNGLPGGYPLRRTQKGVALALPEGISEQEAIEVNLNGLQFDGIDHIDEKGTASFSEDKMAIMNHFLGYSYSKMSLDDSEAMAKELKEKYNNFASRYI